jgi:signal recognition particle subunit SRP54
MFESLSDRLDSVFKNFRGQSRLDEANIKDGLREVRLALLEADVNFKVVKEFTDKVRERCLGQEVLEGLNPGQQVVKIVHDEMVELLGGTAGELDVSAEPSIIMFVGLQGSGKTTSAAKLSLYLRKKLKKKPYLVPADVYRPAAIDQLHTLAKQLDVPAYASTPEMDPVDIARKALAEAKDQGCDVVLLDTAGRLAIDEKLMAELENIKAEVEPQEILFVADAMTGQDAVTTAETFDERLDLSGVVLTKMDGDARGGAALSIRAVTGKAVKFVGMGEKASDLEVFHPDRVVSRILGMGDVMTLIEKAEQAISADEAEELTKKMERAEFDFEDFRTQMRRLKKLGSMESIMKLMPGMKQLKEQMGEMKVPDKELVKVEAMINSMTLQERRNPNLINLSRRKRIAAGSGHELEDINRLVQNFEQMRKMMKNMMGGGKGKNKRKGLPKLPKGMNLPKGMPGAGAGAEGMDGLPGMGGMGGLPGMEGLAGMPGMEGMGEEERPGRSATKAAGKDAKAKKAARVMKKKQQKKQKKKKK